MTRRWTRGVDEAVRAAAQRYGLDPSVLRSIVQIESGGNPRARTGSYSGLFQLSESEFRRLAGRGADITDPGANAMAGAALLASHSRAFERRNGRPPTPGELYMIHQQGMGGFTAHSQNPDELAWRNMASTREGRARGEAWARRAIWDNLTPEMRRRFGSVDNVTSQDFVNFWDGRVQRGIQSQNQAIASGPEKAPPETSTAQPTAQADVPRSTSLGGGPQYARAGEATTPGFFDYNYPLVNAITGTDAPIGQQLIQNIFGGEGFTANKQLGGALRHVGSGLAQAGAEMARAAPVMQSTEVLSKMMGEDQDPRAFAVAEPKRRRPYG